MSGTHRRARLARSRLCLVLEARPHGRDPSELLGAALRGGADVVQLRDKDLPDEELVRAAEVFRRVCDEHDALFVVNDRPDLVERCGADGVHVGQSDAAVVDARRAVGADRLVGLSVTTRDELAAASPDADYLGVGAVFGTPTKPESDAGGLELVRAARDSVRVPWFAIGGVDLETIQDVAGNGAYGVAVVRAVRDADDPETAARVLRSSLTPSAAIVSRSDARSLLPEIDFLESVTAAGGPGALPHTHAAHADLFYVLDGTLEFRFGDETVRVPAGTCVAAPPLFVHGFRNPGDVDAHYLNLHAPGVFARGRTHGLPPEERDTFGVERGSDKVRGILSGPGDGDRLRKEHRLALVKVQRPELDVLEYFVDGEYAGADAHVHLRHADCFHVLEGELELRADGKTIRAGPGTTVVVPPGVVHEFSSVGSARFINVHAPSCGFVEYLRAVDSGAQVDGTRYDMHDPAG